MEGEITVGSTVRLKSGGPLMTVEELIPDKKAVKCTWFEKNKLCREQFPVSILDADDGMPFIG